MEQGRHDGEPGNGKLRAGEPCDLGARGATGHVLLREAGGRSWRL